MFSSIQRAVFLIALTLQPRTLVNGKFMVDGIHDTVLYGYSFLNISVASMTMCLQRCLAECRCMSFQICHDTECQLCSSNKHVKITSLRRMKGCMAYDFGEKMGIWSEEINGQCGVTCKQGINCCLTSQPCQNGGTCILPSQQNPKRRFTCQCPPGYQGPRCYLKITSCSGYIENNHGPGIYQVFDAQTTLYDVYCDFIGQEAWTLVQSYKRDTTKMNMFTQPFKKDQPVSGKGPAKTVDEYRLSKSKMESILESTTKWRITCFKDPINPISREFMQVAHSNVNIFTFESDGSCQKVDSIRVGSRNCSNCTVYLRQKHDRAVHFRFLQNDPCDFKPTDSISCHQPQKGKRYFGDYYHHCLSPEHDCSYGGESLTQTWLGGE